MSITVEIEDDGAVDYEWAINQDANILERLKYLPARNELYNSLWTKRKTICSLIRHQLGLDHRDICNVASPREWIQGSFNVCIPVEVQSNHLHQKYLLRCCLPHKLAETSYPGTMDEKLRCEMVMLENEGIPRTMGTTDTYPSAELYVTDMLTFYDNCLLSNPNAVFDDEDCREKMAVKTLLRALSHRFIRRETRNGPFILQLTDLHASNVFVDDEWNLVCLVDLEWICALPSEMLAVPCWLTGHGVDELEGELLEEFEEMRLEFMRFFEEEEQELVSRHSLSLANIMDETWTSKGVWFWHCIKSLHAMTSLARAHICPQFSTRLTSVAEILSKFWCVDSHRMVEKKVADLQRYEEDLRHCFDRDNAN
ncbi:hypothetical protein BHE90_014197 [Fusarium euwallaceae]|uniref:Aminoglycoside phosphotransferase domain-containing protein n=1 Tax=Fusarium euwallaceae TaxID=1147111 RepID=A0A430L6N4_9HYPO|nr:hypothetical protein BHE90_014197 [Fusarium euwallaceae]